MEEFKIGQVVNIVDNAVTRYWSLSRFIGEVLTVGRIADEGTTIFRGRYVPPQACELVSDVEPTSDVKIPAAEAVAANFLRDICHKASYDAGWWTDAQGNHFKDNPYTFSNKLMLTVSELAEAMEGDRKDLMDDKLPHRKMREVELADTAIRLFDLAGAYGMDIGGAIAEKMEYNRSRIDHSAEARSGIGGKKY